MRRYLGAVLILLGAVGIVGAIGLPLYVAPMVTKLPYDMQACQKEQKPGCLKPSIAEATNAQFLQIKFENNELSVAVNTANLRSTTEVLPQAKLTADQQAAGKLDDNAVIWDVYSTVQRVDTNEVISASTTELALDRVTGAAVDWSGQWLNDSGQNSPISYTDQIYKFPFGTEQRSYKIYDTDVKAASEAKFVGVETIEGLEVYHFAQQIAPTKVDVAASSILVLISRFAPGATSAEVYYSNTREVWVDPVTGAFIKVREQPKQELRANTGATQQLLNADFAYNQQTIANAVESARSNGSQLQLVNLWLPLGLGVVGLILLVVGFLLARTPASGREPQAWDSALPEPRHSLRDDSPTLTG